MKIENKELGVGSISLVLCLIGFLFAFTFKDFSVGDNIINGIGLKAWSNGDSGTHYTIYYSLVFFMPSFLVGLKYKNNYGAKFGRNISATFIVILIMMSLMVVQ